MLALLLNPASYSFNPYAVPTLITALAVFLLGLLVLVYERGSRVSLLFFLVTLAAGLWLFGFSWAYCAAAPQVALWWFKAAHWAIVVIPSAIYHFTVATLGIYQRRRRFVWTSWALSALFAVSIMSTDALISGVYRFWWGYYTRYGWLSLPYLIFFFAMLLMSLRHYWSNYQTARPGAHRQRIKSQMLAFSVAYIAALDYLPAFGLDLYPFGYVPVLIFTGLMARAIRRYRLVDITPALAATQIMDTMADALLVLDPEGVVRIVNQATCRLLRKSDADLVGTPVGALQRTFFTIHELDKLLHGGDRYDYEAMLEDETDRRMTFSVSASVLRDEERQPLAVICVARDISQRKNTEDQLTRQAQELQKANRVKDEFLSVMSHELRTPLNLVMGYTEMLKDRMLGEINPDQDRILGKLLGRARDLLSMISGILEATNIGAQTVTVKAHEINLSDFLDELKAAYDLPLGGGLALQWDIPADLPEMKTDRDKLRHILQNLLNNALKFTSNGRITVSVRYVAGSRSMEFRVLDTGIGIPEEALPSVFEMFHQVDSSETRPYGGVGLGLYIVKKFTELLGGTIEAQSEPQKGSTFTVTLPVIYVPRDH